MAVISDYELIDLSSLEDLYMAMAKTIENSIIQAGGISGKDYTIMDCYRLAQPFVLEVFRTSSSTMTFSAGK